VKKSSRTTVLLPWLILLPILRRAVDAIETIQRQ
jgi:hypothetical protein